MALRLHFLHSIIQEEINQDRIKPRRLRLLRMQPPNLPSQKLDAPDAASAQLDLPRVTARDGVLAPDVRL